MIVLSNLIEMATPTRFELAISALTGPYVKPLHHGAVKNLYYLQEKILVSKY